MTVLYAAKGSWEFHPDEIEPHNDDDLISQATICVGHLKGGGWIYQQTVVGTNSSMALAKLYTTGIPFIATETLNE